MPQTRPRRSSARPSFALLLTALTLSTTALIPSAPAATILLNFVSAPTKDILGTGTTAADFAPFAFTTLTDPQIREASLAAVRADYLSFPNSAADALSPLPRGMELNLNFELRTATTPPADPPANHDPEYYSVAIGTGTTGDGFLGYSLGSAIRDRSGAGPNSGTTTATIIGSILTNNIASLADLATTDAQRINLLAGTIAHEIGHALSLEHPRGPAPNPGQSPFSIMSTGAAPSNMPSQERTTDRAFSYAEFAQLIAAVGLRAVPTPGTLALLSLGGVIALRRRRATAG